ncbi:hypothetical protein K438DRAFT_1985754 [Mycena galopus ATCC 62051]|nr:hypothetical protein K438DRAFT_1985754 [Mycena galopus ATCC 62051]
MAVIAASVISVFLFVSLLFLGLWLRRRRQHIQHNTLPVPYTDDREEDKPSLPNSIVRRYPLPTIEKLSNGSLVPPVNPERVILADIRDDADDGRQTTTPEEQFGGTSGVGTSNESDATPILSNTNTRPDNNTPQDESLALRVQRMEAQLNALLIMSVEEGAPPSYAG